MKTLTNLVAPTLAAPAMAGDAPSPMGTTQPVMHRYMIQRTFPQGALEGLDEGVKKTVRENNAKVGVRWFHSYANSDKTRTFCLYEGPSEDAIRLAAKLNHLPVDNVTEVPFTLTPQ